MSLIGGGRRGEGMGRGVHAVKEVHLQWSDKINSSEHLTLQKKVAIDAACNL